ncbi:MAG: hypothetical protein HOC70_01315 [Gammaproteobacteria bacterium]|nr:hypothetical protein [Gammaproteobacteria bacterium]MBT4491852.1 hypothetical protein [Gammaproteobacteria bacterium]MBT7370305.1 hypothetical protein [Gammaproteobacteria bacterium]
MNNAIRQFRPASNWISAALISVLVISFAALTEAHVRPQSENHMVTEFCTGSSDHSNRFFIRYH